MAINFASSFLIEDRERTLFEVRERPCFCLVVISGSKITFPSCFVPQIPSLGGLDSALYYFLLFRNPFSSSDSVHYGRGKQRSHEESTFEYSICAFRKEMNHEEMHRATRPRESINQIQCRSQSQLIRSETETDSERKTVSDFMIWQNTIDSRDSDPS